MATPCEEYGEQIAYCYDGGNPATAAMYTAYCEMAETYYDMMYGPACLADFHDLVLCFSSLMCADLPMFGNPGYCDVEYNTFVLTCS